MFKTLTRHVGAAGDAHGITARVVALAAALSLYGAQDMRLLRSAYRPGDVITSQYVNAGYQQFTDEITLSALSECLRRQAATRGAIINTSRCFVIPRQALLSSKTLTFVFIMVVYHSRQTAMKYRRHLRGWRHEMFHSIGMR